MGFQSLAMCVKFDIYSTCNSNYVFYDHFFQESILFVISKFADVIIQNITLMSSDIIPFLSAM